MHTIRHFAYAIFFGVMMLGYVSAWCLTHTPSDNKI
jgi:hypothetical protein